MRLFLSTFANKIDKKGRVSVPASFRAVLAAQSCTGVVVYPSFTAPCIEGCSEIWLEKLSDGMQGHYDVFSPEQNDLETLLFSNARPLTWDSEGRVMLPEDLIAHANLGETALFVGKRNTFSIWEPEAYRRYEAEVRARAQQNRLTIPVRADGADGGAA